MSNLVGIVVVAPLMIEPSQMWREPPSLGELHRGVGVLSLRVRVDESGSVLGAG